MFFDEYDVVLVVWFLFDVVCCVEFFYCVWVECDLVYVGCDVVVYVDVFVFCDCVVLCDYCEFDVCVVE